MKLFFLTALVSLFYTQASYALPEDACELRPEFRDAIVRSFQLSCENITAEMMARTTFLNLKDIERIEIADLENFSSIQGLSLGGIDAKFLSKDIFINHPGLTSLTLENFKNPDQIPAGILQNLSDLQKLHIRLRAAPVHVLKDLLKGHTKVSFLFLDISTDQNSSHSLPAGIFSDLKALKDFRFYGEVTLAKGIFLGLESVTRLTVNVNNIEAGAFTGLSQVAEADFTLKKPIVPGMFQGLTSLRDLIIWGDAGDLPSGAFAELSTLKSLTLSADISSFSLGRAFDGLGSLTRLKIRSKAFSGLMTPGMFESLISLEKLTLMNNDLRVIPARVFTGLHNLRLLNLARNEITEVDDELFAPEYFERKTMIYLGFSQLGPVAEDRIRSQHGERVTFDCGDFSLMRGWEYCPIQD